jgi:phosphoribosylformimino-5-aminoimidazole carboxamide ribotide isomerase
VKEDAKHSALVSAFSSSCFPSRIRAFALAFIHVPGRSTAPYGSGRKMNRFRQITASANFQQMSLVILPSIDLRGGKVVRLKQGDYSQQLNYDVDPLQTAAGFAKAGARWMHVIDLDGAREGRPVQLDLIGKLAATAGLQVQVGGGIRTEEDIQRLLIAGAARVVIGTRAMQDWDWFTQLVHNPEYHGKITLALDAKDGIVATHGWTESSSLAAIDVAKKVTGWPLAAILYTDVARDGMLTGPNFEQTAQLARATNIPVIASGGVGSIDHIRTLHTLPVWGAIVGRSLYEGKVDLAEAIAMSR